MLQKVTKQVTLIRTAEGYLWAEMGKTYRTLRGARSAITYDARILAKRGIRTYTLLTVR